MADTTILPIDPESFRTKVYDNKDINLISLEEFDTAFNENTDYIEYYVFDESQNLISPNDIPLNGYSIRDNNVYVDPEKDLTDLGFDEGNYYINYYFYRNHGGSSYNSRFYITEINSDRTEIRLSSNTISPEEIISEVTKFASYRDQQEHFVDFYLNFGFNELAIANNIRIDDEDPEKPTVLIKLYSPLDNDFTVKSTLWLVEDINVTKGYEVKFPVPVFEIQDFEYIAGPNLSLSIKDESGTNSEIVTYENLISDTSTSSQRELQSLLNEKGIKININYESFSEFVKFSSAKTRLENFHYKVGLIEDYTTSLTGLETISSNTTASLAFSSSKASYVGKIDNIIQNLDGYEKFLYFNSGSDYSYPKSNTTKPYTIQPTGSSEVLNWLGSANPESGYYGGVALSASNYDDQNQDWLHFAIPEYLREDPENRNYELFTDMVGQHFDNIWIYTKDIVNKFDADNRLDYGISKDLVADAVKDFGIKLYSNNFNTNDLYEAFLGITPDGATFPSTGSEMIDTMVSASNDIIPLDEMNKRLYKRIYHNIPYLLKTKGTVAGLRALITSYGIPSTVLDINEFGDQNTNSSENYELEQDIFNYKLDVGGNPFTYFSASAQQHSEWGNTHPKSIQFRFKMDNLPTSSVQYNLLSADNNQSVLTVNYTGSSEISGSYSGSISESQKEYATVNYYPQGITEGAPVTSAYVPVFDKGWWSVMLTNDYDAGESKLYIANKENGKIKHIKTSSISSNNAYVSSTTIFIPNQSGVTNYPGFHGSIQEVRFYNPVIGLSAFKDYTMNPLSYVGNSRDTVMDDLSFRSSLGALLDTGSLKSVHPKIQGQNITQSFAGNSTYKIRNASFSTNIETVYFNQPPVGIKNRITDKITVVENTLPEGDTLSPLVAIEQSNNLPSNATPNSNYIEVAFSPTNQVDDDIINQMGNFNLGEYIGDPRQSTEDGKSYAALDTLRDKYFSKYMNSYDIKDFIRLIKYFDNSLFKMIKDFTPARANLSSGVVIKQHILERNKQKRAAVSYKDEQYTGSVKPHIQDFKEGTVYKESGTTGGSFDRYNGLTNNQGVDQTWSEIIKTQYGPQTYIRDDQREFFNGEFSGAEKRVTLQRGTGTESEDPCFAYYTWNGIPQYLYRMSFLSGSDDLFTMTCTSSIPPLFEIGDIQYALSGAFDVNYLGQIQRINPDNVNIVNPETYFDSLGYAPGEFYDLTGSDTIRTASFDIRVPLLPNKYSNYGQLITFVTHSVQEAASTLTFGMITGSAENSASSFEVNVGGNIIPPVVYTASLYSVNYSQSISNNYYYALTASLNRTAHVTASVPFGWLNYGDLISGSVLDPQEPVYLTFMYLGYNLNIQSEACSNINFRFRLDSTYLDDATVIYTENNAAGTGEIVRASTGFYSDGNIIRYWDGIKFGRTERCNLYS
tara:strand:+ start:14718 stop:18971 length:4254 start_codon:yes stop_codon:yes gene_type:complete